MSKLCLVTGANGHLGNNLVRQLIKQGYRVRASVRNPDNKEPFKKVECEIVYGDFLKKESLTGIMKGVDYLFHAAAVFKHWSKNAEEDIIRSNIIGSKNIMEAAAEAKVEKVVYVSSIAALDHTVTPMKDSSWNNDFSNPYYRAKTESEKVAWDLSKKHNLWMASVLPSTIVGGNMFNHTTPSMTLFNSIIKNEMIFDPNFNFNYIDVDDVTKAMIKVTDKGKSGQRYILANKNYVNTSKLFEIANNLYPKTKKPAPASISKLRMISFIGGILGRITGKEPPMLKSWIKLYYQADVRCDITKSEQILGFEPKSNEDVIKKGFKYTYQNQ